MLGGEGAARAGLTFSETLTRELVIGVDEIRGRFSMGGARAEVDGSTEAAQPIVTNPAIAIGFLVFLERVQKKRICPLLNLKGRDSSQKRPLSPVVLIGRGVLPANQQSTFIDVLGYGKAQLAPMSHQKACRRWAIEKGEEAHFCVR